MFWHPKFTGILISCIPTFLVAGVLEGNSTYYWVVVYILIWVLIDSPVLE